MEAKEQMEVFRKELIRRFDELTHWAVDNWPDKSRPLSAVDFVAIRQQMAAAGDKPGESGKQGLDPSEGGPQYIDMDPAPWP